jgi:diguanylate cyclase (GGDEF)-like protein
MLAAFLVLPVGSIEQSAVYDVLGLSMVAASLAGIWIHRPAGWLPWVLLAAGQLAFVIGDVIWTAYAALGEDPFPSTADVAYLLGYPLLALGLGIAIRRRVSGGDQASILDGAILATGAVVVWWSFVLAPLVAATDPEPLSFAISIAYPIGDLLLIGMALGLVMTPGARSAAFGLLIGNLLLLLVGDLLFGIQSIEGTYVDGGWLDGVWLLAYIAFAAAAMHPTMAGLFDSRPVTVTLLSPLRLVLLGGAMLVGPALLTIDQASADAIVLVVAGATAVLSILVLTRLAGIVGHLAEDVERRAGLEAQLSFQAFHDPLTGLANRRRFMHAVQGSLEAGVGTAVLFLDLDDFKDVNDKKGHDAGDALLSAVGHRLVSAVRPDDLACRIGGDEFAVLLPATDRVDAAETVAARLLEALATPAHIEGTDFTIPASVGVAVAAPTEAITVDELLRRADVAMYHAKARGKHRLAIYTEALETRDNPASSPEAAAAAHSRRPRPASAA